MILNPKENVEQKLKDFDEYAIENIMNSSTSISLKSETV